MHILLTNDDGPPSDTASPYILTFARILSSPPLNHTVSIIVPSTQRSWIGKAHLLPPSAISLAAAKATSTSTTQTAPGSSPNESLSDLVTPRYLEPESNQIYSSISELKGKSYWVLVPGTPATCTQLGLFHMSKLFPGRFAPDLVVSGPNLGRNTTAAFALSSGTLGGALEAAVCGTKAIAVSFAFFTKKEGPEIVSEACSHTIRIIEKLMKEWTDDLHSGETRDVEMGKGGVPDVYTINTPLVEGVSKRPVKWTWMLDNKWRDGSLYKHMEADSPVNGSEGPLSFKWQPMFGDIWKTIENSPAGNDGLTIQEKFTSVTPIRANFEGLHGQGRYAGELKL